MDNQEQARTHTQGDFSLKGSSVLFYLLFTLFYSHFLLFLFLGCVVSLTCLLFRWKSLCLYSFVVVIFLFSIFYCHFFASIFSRSFLRWFLDFTGHEGHGAYVCYKCGWLFPNPHPSAKQRRAHKKICGTIESCKLLVSESQNRLNASDDEHLFDDDCNTQGKSHTS